jgi:hypothetical protein
MTGANVCKEPPTVLYHQYLNRLHPKLWEGTLLTLKAFLMTQVRTQVLRNVQEHSYDCSKQANA